MTIDGTIDGAGPSEVSLGITIDASGSDSTPDVNDGFGTNVLSISAQADNTAITLASLTITGGDTPFPVGGGIDYVSYAFNCSLTIRNCKVVGNFTAGEGGGVFAAGSHGLDLEIVETTISGNVSSAARGGGLAVKVTNGSITINRSNIDGNTVTDFISGYGSMGGGVFLESDNSTVTITGTTISGNQILGDHDANTGGLHVKATSSTVVIDGLRVVDNHADDDTGGLDIENDASIVTVRNSSISGNTAGHNSGSITDAAGGVWLTARGGGTNTIENSIISNNKIITDPMDPFRVQNVPGGGLFIHNFAGSTTNIRNTTISGNHAEGNGGGIKISESGETGGQVTIVNSTITNNRANSDNDLVGTGGGIHVGNSATAVTIQNTIVAGNFRGTGSTRDDISGSLAAAFSLIGDNTGASITNNGGNQIGTGAAPIVPGLASLADNGGPTMTHALLPGSPAIDAGSNTLASNAGLTTDQRGVGFPRSFDIPAVTVSGAGPVDIGAFELGAVRVTNVTISGSTSTHAPYAFNGPNDATDADGSGIQLRTVPVGNANTVDVTFSEDVAASIQPSSLTISGLRYGSTPVLAAGGYVYTASTRTARWIFSAPFVADQFLISVSDAIVDANGNHLDGDWVNPKFLTTTSTAVSRFPSGNGVAGGNFNFVFTILLGDASLNNVVNSDDYYLYFLPNYGTNSGATYTQGDFNGNGALTMGDAYIIYMNMNRDLTGMALADWNYDGIVDAADYVLWRNYQGTNVDPWTLGDATGDGLVDNADYQIWARQYGLQVIVAV